MKELEMDMVEDLIYIFKSYINEGLTEKIKKDAKLIQSKYLNTSPLVSLDLTNANGKLTYFYANIEPGPINKDEAKRIIKHLEKIKKRLDDNKNEIS
ncbi:MAG: hypothetical protein QXJ06_05775 [Candidatus Aenigmatarchaeota archaeon]